MKPALAANVKFFVPTAAPSSNERTMEAIVESKKEDNVLGSNNAYRAYGSYSLRRSSTVGTEGLDSTINLVETSIMEASYKLSSQSGVSRRRNHAY
ncbi:hypothetical protein JHK87_000768 [Glycine soja]|nr:hypothetical protein JHK87_000768 [Glycine soja]